LLYLYNNLFLNNLSNGKFIKIVLYMTIHLYYDLIESKFTLGTVYTYIHTGTCMYVGI